MELLLLTQSGQEIMGTPPPTESEVVRSWWPFIAFGISTLIAMISTGFAAWLKLREKRMDRDKAIDQSRLDVELGEMKLQFEARQTLIKNLVDDGTSTRAQLVEAREIHMEKDELIAKLQAEKHQNKAKISSLMDEVQQLKNSNE